MEVLLTADERDLLRTWDHRDARYGMGRGVTLTADQVQTVRVMRATEARLLESQTLMTMAHRWTPPPVVPWSR